LSNSGKVFDKESNERYERFFKRYGAEQPKSHRRDISAMIEGLEYLNEKADEELGSWGDWLCCIQRCFRGF